MKDQFCNSFERNVCFQVDGRYNAYKFGLKYFVRVLLNSGFCSKRVPFVSQNRRIRHWQWSVFLVGSGGFIFGETDIAVFQAFGK
jgi:hypothetical protein